MCCNLLISVVIDYNVFRSISSPRYEELQTLGAIVVNLAAQISDKERRQQESWLSSKSLIRTQIQQLRAQLNELKQIR